MLKIDFSIFPALSTPRLTLRKLLMEDAEAIHQLRSDPEVNRYIDREPSASIEATQQFIKKIIDLIAAQQSLYWVICLNGNDKVIGTICLWNFDFDSNTVELGYELNPNHQGKGIMAEAAKQVIKYTFSQLNADVITAFPSADNARSVALLNKLNFILDEKLTTQIHTEVPNMLAYSLKRSL